MNFWERLEQIRSKMAEIQTDLHLLANEMIKREEQENFRQWQSHKEEDAHDRLPEEF